jgi:hypothetical protein
MSLKNNKAPLLSVWIAVSAFLCALPINAYQWPTQSGEIAITFGQLSAGTIHKNIAILAYVPLDIFPVGKGRVLFTHDTEDDLMPTRSGASVTLQNSDGIRSVYSHMTAVNPHMPETVAENNVLGRAKQNSNSSSYMFYLTFYDNPLNQFVNPLLFLPTLQALNRRPVIGGIYLRLSENRLIQAYNNMTIPGGRAEILVNTFKLSQNGSFSLAPYTISLEFMGNTVTKIQMDAFLSTGGTAVLQGGSRIPAENIYDRQTGNFRLGTIPLMSGQMFITVKVGNIFGVETEQIIRINVIPQS